MILNNLLPVTKESILKEKSEETLFAYYFGESISLMKKYTNPLRTDNKADCTFFYGDDDLLFRDFAERKVYNFIDFIQTKFGISYQEALDKIAVDHNITRTKMSSTQLALVNIQAKHVVSKTKLKKTNKLLNLLPSYSADMTEHLKYYSTFDYLVTLPELKKYRVFGIKVFEMVFDDFKSRIETLPFGFFYFFNNQHTEKQAYNPFGSKQHKFRQVMQSTIIGLEFLRKDKYVIITKSYKDFVILQLCGFNACCILSENYKPSMKEFLILKKYGNQIITLFDNDPTGLDAGKEWEQKFKSKAIYLSTEMKDSYKHWKTYGKEDLTNTLNNLIF